MPPDSVWRSKVTAGRMPAAVRLSVADRVLTYTHLSHCHQLSPNKKARFALKHPLIFYFSLLGECFDRRIHVRLPPSFPKNCWYFRVAIT
jgi:hypothetical protein